MSKANKLLESMIGVSQLDEKPAGLYGILQTSNYSDFIILDDGGVKQFEFQGAKLANKCLPGDHVFWDGEKCRLELRDEHPPIVGTIELTNKSKYGLTSRGIPIYLFTPYNKCYPHFIVGCSEKDVTRNKIGLIKFDDWSASSTFPRGQLQQVLGQSGDLEAERQALIWLCSPWKYPKGINIPKTAEIAPRKELKGYTFNIDPVGCKDVDDVLTFEELDGNAGWRVSITISDVARFVEEGGPIDIYASLIGQTLYSTDGHTLRPMLPTEYSEKECSLIPGKQSYGISLQFIWDGETIRDTEWCESTFQTNRSYSYEEFQESDSPYKTILCQIASYLAGTPIDDSHKWIEQCMLFYNKEAGKLLKQTSQGILRRHRAPDREKLEKYKTVVADIEHLAYSAAEYCLSEEDDTRHFGLESDHYAHASSPIRRYADLVNQRALKGIINGVSERTIVPIAMYDMNWRAKLNKVYARDITFLEATASGKTSFKGIILDKTLTDRPEEVKVKIYIPEWKRAISSKYSVAGENAVYSKDEKRIVDVTDFREVDVSFTCNFNQRSWKERIIINIA
jgi:exoribonuclease R